jgi:hypothetical protein
MEESAFLPKCLCCDGQEADPSTSPVRLAFGSLRAPVGMTPSLFSAISKGKEYVDTA